MRKIALIGYGRWGKVLLPHLQARFEVDIFRRPNEDAFDPSIEAVVVATPIGTHPEIVRTALEKGIPVFCEKPLATDLKVAAELIALAKECGVHLVTDYTYTFSKRLNSAKEYLAGHEIKSLEFYLTRKSPINGRDIRWLLACHALSVLGIFADMQNLSFHAYHEPPFNFHVISYSGDTQGTLRTAMDWSADKTWLHIDADSMTLTMDDLHKDDNVGSALDYFSGVLDGAIDNSRNLEQAYKITEILSKQ